MQFTKFALSSVSVATLVSAAAITQRSANSASTYLGCYADDVNYRSLASAFTSSESMTVATCAAFCSDYSIFGVEYGTECFCGNGFRLGQTDAANCNTACSGDASEICGGNNALASYTNSKALALAVTSGSSKGVALGCFRDYYPNYVLDGASEASDAMTVETCSSFCTSRGFTFAGVEYARECHCGSIRPTVASSSCDMPCTGNSQEICGGGNAINVVELAWASAPAATTSISSTSRTTTSATSAATSSILSASTATQRTSVSSAGTSTSTVSTTSSKSSTVSSSTSTSVTATSTSTVNASFTTTPYQVSTSSSTVQNPATTTFATTTTKAQTTSTSKTSTTSAAATTALICDQYAAGKKFTMKTFGSVVNDVYLTVSSEEQAWPYFTTSVSAASLFILDNACQLRLASTMQFANGQQPYGQVEFDSVVPSGSEATFCEYRSTGEIQCTMGAGYLFERIDDTLLISGAEYDNRHGTSRVQFKAIMV